MPVTAPARPADRRAAAAPTSADAPWTEHAACRGGDVELFYSQEEDDQRRALAVCATCPVRQPCHDHAMAAREAFGVWGGTLETERRRLFRRERRRRAEERRRHAA